MIARPTDEEIAELRAYADSQGRRGAMAWRWIIWLCDMISNQEGGDPHSPGQPVSTADKSPPASVTEPGRATAREILDAFGRWDHDRWSIEKESPDGDFLSLDFNPSDEQPIYLYWRPKGKPSVGFDLVPEAAPSVPMPGMETTEGEHSILVGLAEQAVILGAESIAVDPPLLMSILHNRARALAEIAEWKDAAHRYQDKAVNLTSDLTDAEAEIAQITAALAEEKVFRIGLEQRLTEAMAREAATALRLPVPRQGAEEMREQAAGIEGSLRIASIHLTQLLDKSAPKWQPSPQMARVKIEGARNVMKNAADALKALPLPEGQSGWRVGDEAKQASEAIAVVRLLANTPPEDWCSKAEIHRELASFRAPPASPQEDK